MAEAYITKVRGFVENLPSFADKFRKKWDCAPVAQQYGEILRLASSFEAIAATGDLAGATNAFEALMEVLVPSEIRREMRAVVAETQSQFPDEPPHGLVVVGSYATGGSLIRRAVGTVHTKVDLDVVHLSPEGASSGFTTAVTTKLKERFGSNAKM